MRPDEPANDPRSLLPPGYAVRERAVDVEGRTVRLFQVQDPNALADAVPEERFEEDERFPYWAELWPSGMALARFVLRRHLGAGIDAVELGCGLGLAGIAAALDGARVVFTDFEPDALAFARANHALNLGAPGRTRLLDWREPPGDLRARLVLASDVLYERRFFEPFLATLLRVLEPGGTALVAEPGRTMAEGVVEALEARGLERRLHLEEFAFQGADHAVWLHEVRAPARP